MKINWEVRFKNPVFWAQILLAVLTPILAYSGLALKDLTTWNAVFDTVKSAVLNPYVLGLVAVSVFNALNDPTTKGLSDSNRALQYAEPFNAMKINLNHEGNECDE